MLSLLTPVLCLSSLLSCGPVSRAAGADEPGAAFEYREIYLPGNAGDQGRELKLHNLNDEWGLWGHNLPKVLPREHSRSIYATVQGRTTTEQFCFSSEQLYQYIEDYISRNYGSRRGVRFAIMPADNHIVCLCERCTAQGCTATDASPAVNAMIERLAERFPVHTFFTSDYLTTRTPPQRALPANTGVLLSAIRYGLCARPTAAEDEMRERIQAWSRVTAHVYVWDYINNFDDYFTPYPTFAIVQRRLQLYRDAGVRGVFFNGSGTDYSTFSRLRSHIIAALLLDPDTDWRTLLRQKCQELYPVCGEAIFEFMTLQEQKVAEGGRTLPLYEGVAAARGSYLFEEDFVPFHDRLAALLPQTSGLERQDLTTIYRALCLTRLELKRLHADTSGTQPMLRELQRLGDDGVRIYSESFWNVETYISEYRQMLSLTEESRKHNRLLHRELTALTALDPDYRDVSVLTDGLASLPSNYHCGQLISSADPWLRIAIPQVPGLRHLRVGLVSNVQFHIALPLRVTLSAAGRDLATVEPRVAPGVATRTAIDFDVPANLPGTLILTIVRNPDERTMAIDEIEGW